MATAAASVSNSAPYSASLSCGMPIADNVASICATGSIIGYWPIAAALRFAAGMPFFVSNETGATRVAERSSESWVRQWGISKRPGQSLASGRGDAHVRSQHAGRGRCVHGVSMAFLFKYHHLMPSSGGAPPQTAASRLKRLCTCLHPRGGPCARAHEAPRIALVCVCVCVCMCVCLCACARARASTRASVCV